MKTEESKIKSLIAYCNYPVTMDVKRVCIDSCGVVSHMAHAIFQGYCSSSRNST